MLINVVAKSRERQRNQVPQRQGQIALDQHTDHAQSMAAQRKWVFVAGRQVADAEHAGQGFELIGQRDHQADRVARGSSSPAKRGL